ncbi:MAG: S8 family serine peptidase [Planctomycetes bacterium]|nr:S8 family serine peptidase [Planctomycetota bacterium]
MKMYAGSKWLASVHVAVVLAGCGGVTLPESTENQSFEFADDADPALAALPFVETELLVQPYPGADAAKLARLYFDAGASQLETFEEIDLTVLKVSADNLHKVAAQLADSSLLETIAKNYVFEVSRIPNDPAFEEQSYLDQIHVPEAWDTSIGSEEMIVAVVDSGVDADHPDLRDRLLVGWNVQERNTNTVDAVGHGTHVAGLVAAAANNEVGVAGVSWDSPLLPVRVTDDRGRVASRHLAAGILWALSHDARVINVSFAPLWGDRVVRAAATCAFNRGAIVVISAGNGSGTTTARGYREALFVGAVNRFDRIASFSDRGPFVDLVAPGVSLYSPDRQTDYSRVSGTSFAAPIVSGVVALAWAVNPDVRPVSIQAAVLESSVDLGLQGEDSTYGYGLVDAAAAVSRALEIAESTDETPPEVEITRPKDGARLTRRFVVYAPATDSPKYGGVADVVLSIDGIPFATDTRTPYRFVMDPGDFSIGEHELRVVATDRVGNSSAVARVSVTFASSSSGGADYSSTSIEFESPANGSSVTGTVTINALITNANGLASVEWLLDGDTIAVGTLSGQSTRVTFVWRSTNSPRGEHTITIIATDAAGRQTRGDLQLTRR